MTGTPPPQKSGLHGEIISEVSPAAATACCPWGPRPVLSCPVVSCPVLTEPGRTLGGTSPHRSAQPPPSHESSGASSCPVFCPVGAPEDSVGPSPQISAQLPQPHTAHRVLSCPVLSSPVPSPHPGDASETSPQKSAQPPPPHIALGGLILVLSCHSPQGLHGITSEVSQATAAPHPGPLVAE